jgi:hypothetical protein
MGRTLLLLFGLLGIGALALVAVNGATPPNGMKQRLSQEGKLSVIAHAASIDQRQPQHLKTATFALG